MGERTTTAHDDGTGDPWQRWVVLGVGMLGLVAACAFQYGLPFLVPAFRRSGLSLTQAGSLVSAPVFGVLCALVLWGAITDRVGERWVLVTGLSLAAVALGAAVFVTGALALAGLLFVAGASAACVQVASGRLILGWFPARRRGLAMGVRQTGQPLGVGLAALVLPPLGAVDPARALAFLAAACAVAAVAIAVAVRDPVRDPVTAGDERSPYRGTYLWRVHAASALLVVPQFTVAAFAFDYLVTGRSWPASSAGPLLALAQAGGAAIRLGAGWWSDRVGSRLRPMRWLAVATAGVLVVLTAGAAAGWGVAVPALVVAAVLTVSTNGLAFTAVAERAGAAWAGRALGVQNTAQNVAAAATPPLAAVLITGVGGTTGYAAAFGAVLALPLVAAGVTPVGHEGLRPDQEGLRPGRPGRGPRSRGATG